MASIFRCCSKERLLVRLPASMARTPSTSMQVSRVVSDSRQCAPSISICIVGFPPIRIEMLAHDRCFIKLLSTLSCMG